MFEGIKKKIAGYVIESKIIDKDRQAQSFKGIFQEATYFFVVISEDENDFYHCFETVKFLLQEKKNVTIFINESKLKLVQNSALVTTVTYSEKDVTKLMLPSKDLRASLGRLSYEAVIDLNRKENLFCSAAANLVKSDIRMGFVKPGADKFYNLQFANGDEKPEVSYRKLKTSLQMF
jgi:hypothetical protein